MPTWPSVKSPVSRRSSSRSHCRRAIFHKNTIMSAPAIPLTDARARLPEVAAITSPLDLLGRLVRAAASLKLTVVLFALGIFIVLAGTLAQTSADIWQVVRDYFHAWMMWVDVNLFFPKSFFPHMPH